MGAALPDVARILSNLAELDRVRGRYAEAEPLYKRALTIWEKAVGADSPDVALGLNNLAALYDAQGRYAEAEPEASAISEECASRERCRGISWPSGLASV